jgi:hypothetical protein
MQNNPRQEQIAAMLARILKRLRPAEQRSTNPKHATADHEARDAERIDRITHEPIGGN